MIIHYFAPRDDYVHKTGVLFVFSRRIYLRSLMFNAFVVFINLKTTTKINFNRLLHPFVLFMII